MKSDIDLRRHLVLAVEHMLNTLDERIGYVPFFHFELVHDPVYLKHGAFDAPHVVGRYLDALGRCSSIIDLPDANEAYDALARQIYESLRRHPSGMPWNLPQKWLPDVAVMHNCRENLLGLIALHRWRNDENALRTARVFCQSIQAALGEDQHFSTGCLGRNGWVTAFSGLLDSPPATTGRMIRPLVQLFRLSGDELVLELATRFVDDNLQSSFTEDGNLKEKAGAHVHSILGTLTGLLDYGLLTGSQSVIERTRRVLDVGLHGLHSTFGWAKEFIWSSRVAKSLRTSGYPDYDIPRGEANNTADLIEAALLLGKLGDPSGFEKAENFLRNHLLATQITDVTWVCDNRNMNDTEDTVYKDIARRGRGGWCFGSPNDLISYPGEFHQVNTDLAGGASQAICEAWEAITEFDGRTLRVNLLFSKEDDLLKLVCPAAVDLPIMVQLKVNAKLAIRVPGWVNIDQVIVQIDDHERRAAKDLISRSYLRCEPLVPGTKVRIWLPGHQKKVTETILGKEYTVEWLNGTVIGIDPPGQQHALYGNR